MIRKCEGLARGRGRRDGTLGGELGTAEVVANIREQVLNVAVEPQRLVVHSHLDLIIIQ